jgi:hypothetical protein
MDKKKVVKEELKSRNILHAPGSLLTYEPQRASDVAVFFQSMVEGR